MQTVEIIALKERAALKKVVEPIGSTCSSIRIDEQVIIDTATAEAIRDEPMEEINAERSYKLRFTELDLENKTGKIRFYDDDPENRVNASIIDPAFLMKDNVYKDTFLHSGYITVRAKAGIKDGEIIRLYISDAVKE